MPSSLGGRLIVLVRQGGRQTKILQFATFKIYNFNSKAHLGCLNGFMVPVGLHIYMWPVFEGNIIVWLVFQTQKVICIPCQSLLLSTYYRTY